MAEEHGIDLSHVPGTGLGGRISKRDVERYLESLRPGESGCASPERRGSGSIIRQPRVLSRAEKLSAPPSVAPATRQYVSVLRSISRAKAIRSRRSRAAAS